MPGSFRSPVARGRSPVWWLAIAGWLALAWSASPASGADPADRSRYEDKGHELLDYDCLSDISRRQITLFGNGTVRLREGPRGRLEMSLRELDPVTRDGYVERLLEVELGETGSLQGMSGPDGAWVELCSLILDLPGDRPRRYELSRFESPPLGLGRIVQIAELLIVDALPASGFSLPFDYEAKPGDVLEDHFGVHFRVVTLTADKRGVEMEAETEPITLIVGIDDLRSRFVRVVSRHRAFGFGGDR